MLVLSKRLHSIYVLRCFNDCFAMSALFTAIYCYQRKQWSYGSVAFSCGLGIKMNLLLVFPGIVTIMYQALGPVGTITELFWMLQIQVKYHECDPCNFRLTASRFLLHCHSSVRIRGAICFVRSTSRESSSTNGLSIGSLFLRTSSSRRNLL